MIKAGIFTLAAGALGAYLNANGTLHVEKWKLTKTVESDEAISKAQRDLEAVVSHAGMVKMVVAAFERGAVLGPHSTPSPYVPREAAENQIRDAIRPQSLTGGTMYVIWGAKGTGKSTLAVKIALEEPKLKGNGVIYVHCNSSTTDSKRAPLTALNKEFFGASLPLTPLILRS